MLGYDRYAPAPIAINAVYADRRLLQNPFFPMVKLVTKERRRARRRYDRPQTPLERVRQSTAVHKGRLVALVTLQQTIDPFVLAKRIDHALAAIYQLANHRRTSARVDAARPVDAQKRVHQVGGNHGAGFPQRRHASSFSTTTPVTRVMTR